MTTIYSYTRNDQFIHSFIHLFFIYMPQQSDSLILTSCINLINWMPMQFFLLLLFFSLTCVKKKIEEEYTGIGIPDLRSNTSIHISIYLSLSLYIYMCYSYCFYSFQIYWKDVLLIYRNTTTTTTATIVICI